MSVVTPVHSSAFVWSCKCISVSAFTALSKIFQQQYLFYKISGLEEKDVWKSGLLPPSPQGSCLASAEVEGWWEAPLCTLADVGLVAVVSMAILIIVAGTPKWLSDRGSGAQSHFLSPGITWGHALDRQASLAGEVGTLPKYTCLCQGCHCWQHVERTCWGGRVRSQMKVVNTRETPCFA